MEAYNDLNNHIRLTTLKIQEDYPELVKYMNEIPRNYLNKTGKEVNEKELKGYLNSLNNLIKTYTKTH
ncbi:MULTISPECIES: hypothetical protein [Bizionia]|uniref:Uncharacterized protein n=1 Tax=Bizionia algoritergicola TaxID=291187 RepID=A0A5D0QY63_9FLAO|nr:MULTISPECIES: hypothetical protein [Bizionia]OBX23423.1 hypothetical protein BAA08_05055 [Bizionia sp. APA-3]TYB73418.1 hypothetical protein ES675_07090 [Bizionia algoritergicola]